MNEQELISKIQLLKAIKPTEEWVLSCRAKLAFRLEMNRKKDILRQDTFALKELFAFLGSAQKQPSWRWAHSLIIAIMVVLSGGALTTWAAVQSQPGSPLYPVKLAIERARVSASLSEESRLKLQVQLADTRLQELKVVVNSQDDADQKAEKMSQVAASIQDQLVSANNQLPKSGTVIEPKEALATAKIVSDRATQASRALVAAKESLPDEIEPNIKLKLAEATEAVEKTGIAALEAIIINQGVSSSTKEEIITKLDNEIKLVAERVKTKEKKIADSDSFADRLPKLSLALPIRAVLINQLEQVLDLLDKAKEALANDDASGALELLKAARAIDKGADKMTEEAVLPEVKGMASSSVDNLDK